jgi:chaperonin GroEL (HSP60 family)
MAEPLLNRNFHPTVIVSGYCKALQKALEVCAQICRVIDVDNIKVCHCVRRTVYRIYVHAC